MLGHSIVAAALIVADVDNRAVRGGSFAAQLFVPLVYVTGSAGSGKSAVAVELSRRGVAAYDEDDPAIGSAHNIRSGAAVAVPPVRERSQEWFSEHEWRLRSGVLDDLRARARNGLVVLCGNALPPDAAVKSFDRVFHLEIDEDTLGRRVMERTDNDYGKSPDELMAIRERHRKLAESCSVHGVIGVDATQELTKVADDIVKASSGN